jgi:hypothetical protein
MKAWIFLAAMARSRGRAGPGGQERERLEFTEEFPAMDGYSANVRGHCRLLRPEAR